MKTAATPGLKFALSLLLFWTATIVAALLVAGDVAIGRSDYDTLLTVRDLYRIMLQASIGGLLHPAVFEVAAWLVAGLLVASTATLITRHKHASRARSAAFAAQLLIVWPGWIGLLSLPFQFLSGPIDGEWLGESWPIMQVSGLWILLSTIIAVREYRVLGVASAV